MFSLKLFISIFLLSLAFLSPAKHQDLSLIAPATDLRLPDPEVRQLKKSSNKIKPLTALEMSENFTLEPRLEYENYLDIKPTKPQTFGLNFNWDI